MALGFKNANVQRLRRLVRDKAFRDAEGAFVVEGLKVLDQARSAGLSIEAVYAPVGTLIQCDYELEIGVLERVASTITPQPVIAIVRKPNIDRARILNHEVVLVLEDVQDPGNAGTVIRSAESAGIGGVVFCGRSVDFHSPKTVRSSAGSLFFVDAQNWGPSDESLKELHRAGFAIYGTTMHGGVVYDHAPLSEGRVAIVLGNEGNGLDLNSPLIDHWLSIPIAGRSESLNVSMAASILSFEVARQRRAGDSDAS